MARCCRCNKTGKCRRCSCATKGVACKSCQPGEMGKCHNHGPAPAVTVSTASPNVASPHLSSSGSTSSSAVLFSVLPFIIIITCDIHGTRTAHRGFAVCSLSSLRFCNVSPQARAGCSLFLSIPYNTQLKELQRVMRRNISSVMNQPVLHVFSVRG